MYIVTHTSPDMDAITACWLLQRFGGFDGAEVKFVNTGAPDPEILAGAAAVVDTGREYDPKRFRFDHHQDSYPDSATARVAMQVIDGNALAWLTPLIALVHHGDMGSRECGAGISRDVGLHAALSGAKARKLSDADLLAYGCQLLDDVASALKTRAEATATLDACTVWKSDDGLVWALKDAGPAATHAAGEFGARLVVYSYAKEAEGEQPATYGMGCWRTGGAEVTTPHVGEVVALAATAIDTPAAVADELNRWFRHPAGFCALSGSDKAPRTDEPAVGVTIVAQAISAWWTR